MSMRGCFISWDLNLCTYPRFQKPYPRGLVRTWICYRCQGHEWIQKDGLCPDLVAGAPENNWNTWAGGVCSTPSYGHLNAKIMMNHYTLMELHIDGVPMKDMTYWWGTLSSDKPMCEHAAFGWHGLKKKMRHPEMAKENQFFSIIWTIPFQTKPTFSSLSCLREPTRCVLKKGLWIFQRKRHGCKGLFQLWHWNTILVHHQTLAADRGCIAEARWKRAWGKHGTDARRWCHHQPSACLGLWLDVQLRSWSWGHIKHGFLQFCIDPECWFIRVMGTEEMHAVKSHTVPLFIEIVLWFLPRNCMNLLPWLKYTTTKAVKLFKINFPFYFEPLQPLGLDPAVCCDARCANSLHLLRLEGELGYSDG